MTLDQIEEMRRGEYDISPSLQKASQSVGLGFRQCPDCRGRGFTKATLLVSVKAMQALARDTPKEFPPIQYDRCFRCDGTGGFVSG
jgi:hypothetical protein